MEGVQRRLFTTVRVFKEDESTTGAILRNSIAEIFPSGALLKKKLRAIPALHTELSNLLDKRGWGLTEHSYRRIIMTLACYAFKEVLVV